MKKQIAISNDGDTDFWIDADQTGLKFLRNDGSNSNLQLKLRLIVNRSHASGLEVRVELTAGGLREIRTVKQLPIEIGVDTNQKLISLYDETKLVVVDQPDGTQIFPNDKLLQGKLFPPSELITYLRAKPILKAVRSDGLDVTG